MQNEQAVISALHGWPVKWVAGVGLSRLGGHEMRRFVHSHPTQGTPPWDQAKCPSLKTLGTREKGPWGDKSWTVIFLFYLFFLRIVTLSCVCFTCLCYWIFLISMKTRLDFSLLYKDKPPCILHSRLVMLQLFSLHSQTPVEIVLYPAFDIFPNSLLLLFLQSASAL